MSSLLWQAVRVVCSEWRLGEPIEYLEAKRKGLHEKEDFGKLLF